MYTNSSYMHCAHAHVHRLGLTTLFYSRCVYKQEQRAEQLRAYQAYAVAGVAMVGYAIVSGMKAVSFAVDYDEEEDEEDEDEEGRLHYRHTHTHPRV